MSKKREYPKEGTKFYSLTISDLNEFTVEIEQCDFSVMWSGYCNLFDCGNFFLTKREALAAKRKLQAAIKDVFKH